MTVQQIISNNEKVMDGLFLYCRKQGYNNPFVHAICFEMGDDCTPDTECPLAHLCGKDPSKVEELAKELITTGKFQLH